MWARRRRLSAPRLRGCRCARTVGFLIRWGHHRPVYRRRNSARGLTGRCRRHRRGRVRVRRRITTFVAETGNVLESPRPLDVPRPRETASRWPSFASLTRTPLRASCLRCLRGRGTAEAASPFLSPPGLSIPHRATWSAGQVCTYRPAPLAAAALRVARSYTFSVRGVENAIF